jgi:NADH:ubiquinone oxidoreductase subunit 6 (subunit J)
MLFAQLGLDRLTGAAWALVEFVRAFWPILIPVALGMAAVYLLLPRARGYPPLWGGLLGGVALVFAGWSLIRSDARLGETILFYSFSAVAIVAGVLLIAQRNPARAALSFALVVLASCGLFLLQAAPFLMAATTIVYAGAIIVTFLFVIMLAQQAGPSDADSRSREPLLSTIAGFVLLGGLLCVLHKNYDTEPLSVLDPLDEYFNKAAEAARAKTPGQIEAALGDEARFFDNFVKKVEEIESESDLAKKVMSRVRDGQQDLEGEQREVRLRDYLLNAQSKVVSRSVPLEKKTALLRDVSRVGKQIRYSFGSLQYTAGKVKPSGANLPLSDFSGPRPNLPIGEIPTDAEGKPALPAANVASLGKSLFTDYVLAVELAGTLLLVAVIGAIAIAGRRPEGLR